VLDGPLEVEQAHVCVARRSAANQLQTCADLANQKASIAALRSVSRCAVAAQSPSRLYRTLLSLTELAPESRARLSAVCGIATKGSVRRCEPRRPQKQDASSLRWPAKQERGRGADRAQN
jgi:hypothetical protein